MREMVIHYRNIHCLSCRLERKFGKPYPKVHTHPIAKVLR